MGIKIFNNFPAYIKDISYNVKIFEICLDNFSFFLLHRRIFFIINISEAENMQLNVFNKTITFNI